MIQKIMFFTMLKKIFLIKIILIAVFQLSFAQNSDLYREPVDVPEQTIERLKDIYEGREFSVKYYRGDWLPDGSGYLRFENGEENNNQSLVLYDPESGDGTILVSSEQLNLPESDQMLRIEDYVSSQDGDQILLEAEVRESDDRSQYYWMLDVKSGKLQEVSGGSNNNISPDGNRILYSEDGNLFVYDIPDEKTTQLTFDAVDGTVYNGNANWSPDGAWISFVQSDASRVRKRASLIPGDPSYPEVREQRFARVGGEINSLKVGVVDAAGEKIKWLTIPLPEEGFYLGEISWTGNSNELMIEHRSRFRDHREFFIANVQNGLIKSIYEESDPAWVVASYRTNGGADWINDDENFIILSEKEGWRQAYLYSREGKFEKKLTPGEYDIIDRVGIDEEDGWFYFYASPENGTQKYLYRVSLKGKGKAVRISPDDQPGWHDYDLSPGGKWAFHTYSSWNSPPVTELVKLPEHKVVRILEDNKDLREKMESLDPQPKEFITLKTKDGYKMDAWMIKPSDFDPSLKYPVFVYVYGEPHAQTVKDLWGHGSASYHRVIADLGYIVVSIDNRGTPCPKGAAWRRAIAGSLGPLSTREQAEGLEDLASTRPYVDLSRVGIWGWSGGGSNTLNAVFRKPDLYDVGIAVAPKPQPHLYNAWFQEIYMKTPEVNPEGYEKSAPINYAEGLKGNLLIIHGSGETNTHVQITEGLVDRLIELGKQFDYMCYPNRDHGIRRGEGTSLHLRIHMVKYLLRHLPAGGR